MIEISVSWAVAVFLSVPITLVLGVWIFYNCRDEEPTDNTEFLTRCQYCGHMFFNYRRSEIIVCPLCKSYLSADLTDKQGDHQKDATQIHKQ